MKLDLVSPSVRDLGIHHMTVGNTEKCSIDCEGVLDPGVFVESATTSTDSDTAVAVSPATLLPDKQSFHFLITVSVAETFDVTVTVMLSDGQVLVVTFTITVDNLLEE